MTGLGRLHVITDTRPGRDPIAAVGAALEVGAPVVQVRAKELSDLAYYEFASRVADLCAQRGAACLVNDRPDIAFAIGASGVHLGLDDLPVAAARRVVSDDLFVGATARNADHARSAEAAGADYIGVGPVYASHTKAGLPSPLGIPAVSSVAESVRLPVIAIGGVTALRVPGLLAAGAYGIAVVSAISEADDPWAATEELLKALGE